MVIAHAKADGSSILEPRLVYTTQSCFIVNAQAAETHISATLIFGSGFASVARNIGLGSGDRSQGGRSVGELRIVAATGRVGYGFPEESLPTAFDTAPLADRFGAHPTAKRVADWKHGQYIVWRFRGELVD